MDRMGGIVAHAYAAAMEVKATSRFGPQRSGFGSKPRARAYLRVLRGVSLLLGPCFLLVAIAFAAWEGLPLHSGLSAEGTVVRLETEHNAQKNSDTYAPVLVFQTPEGRQYKIVGKVASSPPEFTVGDRVPVKYHKEQPAAAQIASFWQNWFLPALFGCLGAGLSAIGLLLSLGERWLKRDGSSQKTLPVR